MYKIDTEWLNKQPPKIKYIAIHLAYYWGYDYQNKRQYADIQRYDSKFLSMLYEIVFGAIDMTKRFFVSLDNFPVIENYKEARKNKK